MSHKSLFASLVALTLLAGCIPSLNPVYLPEDLVSDPRVVGTWRQPADKASWVFSEREGKSYGLLYTDNQGRQGRFVAHLAKIEGELFLDLFPEEFNGSANSVYTFHYVPIHTIYLVREIGTSLELAAIDLQWLEKELEKEPATIQSSTVSGRHLITASTKEVREFVVKNKDSFTARFDLQRAPAKN